MNYPAVESERESGGDRILFATRIFRGNILLMKPLLRLAICGLLLAGSLGQVQVDPRSILDETGSGPHGRRVSRPSAYARSIRLHSPTEVGRIRDRGVAAPGVEGAAGPLLESGGSSLKGNPIG